MGTTAVLLLVAAMAVAAVDWWAVATGAIGVEYLAKPAVIVVLVGLALAVETDDSVVRGLVVAALGASVVGDVILMLPDGPFVGGLLAFLVAHLLYVVALAGDAQPAAVLVGAGLVAAAMFAVAPTLLEAVARRGRPVLSAAVMVYVGAVGATAVLGVGTATVLAGVGGLAFLASDALLGWGRFVGPTPGGRVLVHVTYHVAQIALVSWLVVT